MSFNKKIIAAFMAAGCTIFLTGCFSTTTVTHDYSNFKPVSQTDAIQTLCERRGRLPFSDQFTLMETVDANGFEYAADNRVSNEWYLLAGPAIGQLAFSIAEQNSAGQHPHLGRVNFADVWQIQLMIPPFNNNSAIRLNLHNEFHDYYMILCHKDHPEVNDSILSALLVLCPNVK
jgi:hypothetical protein